LAFSLKNKKGPIAEINVTPLVDVMLVLLVIFMVTAPLLFSGITLQLPKTKEVNNLNLSTSQVVLSYTLAGNIFIGEDRVLHDELIAAISEQFKKNNTDILYVRADSSVKYGQIAKLMSFLKRGGVSNISLVTEIEE
jgi:biopolymer transport protein TolR